MSERRDVMVEMAGRVRAALEAQDLSAYRDLLDPGVQWGAPGARKPTCKNRDQVLAWYQRANDGGVRGQVSDVEIVGDRILVSMTVVRTPGAKERGGVALR